MDGIFLLASFSYQPRSAEHWTTSLCAELKICHLEVKFLYGSVSATSIVRTVIAVRSLKGEKVAPSGIGRLIMNRMGCASIGQRFVPVVPLTHASLLAIALAHVSSQRLNTEDPRRDFFDKKNADIGDICAAWMTEQVRFTSNARLIRQLPSSISDQRAAGNIRDTTTNLAKQYRQNIVYGQNGKDLPWNSTHSMARAASCIMQVCTMSLYCVHDSR